MVAPPAVPISVSGGISGLGQSSHASLASPIIRPFSPEPTMTIPRPMSPFRAASSSPLRQEAFQHKQVPRSVPQEQQNPNSNLTWSDQIRLDAQEARIQGLESNLAAERDLHLRDTEDLRKSNETLRSALVRAEAALRAREDDLSKSKAMLVQFDIELNRRRASEERWRSVAQGLQTELELFRSQTRQDEARANEGLIDRERNVAGLSRKCKDAIHDNAVKDRQVQLMLTEIENAERRAFIAVEKSNSIAKEAEEKRQREVAIRDEEIEMLRARTRETEKHLSEMKARFQILQKWCFRVWWSVEGIFSKERSRGGVLEAKHSPPSRRHRAVLGMGHQGTRKEFKYPNDWRQTLQMQFAATAFWAQDVFKARVEKREEEIKSLQSLVEKVGEEVADDQARRETLQQSWLKVERTVWQREKEHLQDRNAQMTDALNRNGFRGPPPSSIDMEELYAWAAKQAQFIQTELGQIKPTARMGAVQEAIAELNRPQAFQGADDKFCDDYAAMARNPSDYAEQMETAILLSKAEE